MASRSLSIFKWGRKDKWGRNRFNTICKDCGNPMEALHIRNKASVMVRIPFRYCSHCERFVDSRPNPIIKVGRGPIETR